MTKHFFAGLPLLELKFYKDWGFVYSLCICITHDSAWYTWWTKWWSLAQVRDHC